MLDIDFINGHTQGFEDLATDLRSTSWESVERESALSRGELRAAACVYTEANSTILVYGIGVTQHRRGAETVQQIANLALLRGNVGRPGAGSCPVRGHSNVQGDRTVGITERPSPDLSIGSNDDSRCRSARRTSPARKG
jgi:anaerobic selenocysteine-containing dehydrogenase